MAYDAIIENQAAVDWLMKTHFDDKPKNKPEYGGTGAKSLLTDEQVIEFASNAKNGDLFRQLMAGDVTGFASQSEADASLCSRLAFWCGNDREQIDRIFRMSGLYRDKWDEKHGAQTYGGMTIERHLSRETYSRNTKPEEPKAGEPTSNEILQAQRDNEVGDAGLLKGFCEGIYIYDSSESVWYRFVNPFWELDKTESVYDRFDDVIDVYRQEATRQGYQRQEAAVELGQKYSEQVSLFGEEVNQRDRLKKKEKLHEQSEAGLIARVKALQALDRRKRVVTLARMGAHSLATAGDSWDADPYLLACLNGVIDLKTGTIRDGRPEDLIKSHSPVEYKGLGAPALVWGKFLNEIFNNDKELIAYIQKALGYCFIGSVPHHIIFILWGIGRNGKSTMLELIKYVMGDYAFKARSEILLESKFSGGKGSPDADTLALRGKRLILCSETDDGRKLNAGRIKEMTGGDTLSARAPYGRYLVEFTPTYKLFLLTNFRPQANASDYALWKRIHLIPFELSFVDEPKEKHERKADPKLPDKLKAEASGILSWLVEGCLKYQQEGLNPPEKVKAATEKYREDEDLISQFIAERCEINPNSEVKAGDLYKSYSAWCEDNGIRPSSGIKFGSEIKKRFNSFKRGCNFYIGISLKNVED